MSGKRIRYASLTWITLVTIVILVLSACSLFPKEQNVIEPPLVKPVEDRIETYTVKRKTIQKSYKGIATFRSVKSSNLFFAGSGGHLKKIYVQSGDRVKQNQLIAELDAGDLEQQLKLQRLSFEKATLDYKIARMTGISGYDLRYREIALETEKIKLEALENQRDQLRILSTMNGIVTFVADISEGDAIQSYQKIVTISDNDSLAVVYDAGPNDKDLGKIEVGMAVQLKTEAGSYKAVIVQNILRTDKVNDNEQGSINRIIMKPLDNNYTPKIGSQAEFEVLLEKRENALVVPRAAIHTYLGRNLVQILDGERRREVDVELGIQTATEVECLDGLSEGQQIILNH